jgi:hypothetical protein
LSGINVATIGVLTILVVTDLTAGTSRLQFGRGHDRGC